MEKTALQQLIEYCEKMMSELKSTDSVSNVCRLAFYDVACHAKENLIQVERDAIVDAVEKGRYMKHETGLYVTGEQYYRTKYGETE